MNASDVPVEGQYEKGLGAIYDMTLNFLELVHPLSSKVLYEALDVKLLSDGKVTTNGKYADWKFWVGQYPGFFACLVIGLLFVILVPFGGMIYGCCRCAGKCGSNAKTKYITSKQKYLRSFLIALLFLTSIFILAGAVCAFMTNDHLDKSIYESPQTQRPSGHNLFQVLEGSLKLVQNFLTQLLNEVPLLLENLNATILAGLSGLSIESELLLKIRNTTLYQDLVHINSDVKVGCKLLDDLIDNADKLKNLSGEADKKRENTLSKLNENGARCEAVVNCRNIRNLLMNTNIKNKIPSQMNTLGNQSDLCTFDFERVLNDTLKELIEPQRSKISSSISNVISNSNEVNKTIYEELQKISAQLELPGNIKTEATKYMKYETYRFYICVAVSAFVLLVVLLNFLGVMLGLCRSEVGPGARTCGANMLLCNLILICLFSSILMVVVIIVFLSGGVIYTETCKGFEKEYSNSAVMLIDSLGRSFTHSSEFSILRALDGCQENVGIVEALSMKTYFETQFDYKNKIRQNINSSSFGEIRVENLPDLSKIYEILKDLRIDNATLQSLKDLSKNIGDVSEEFKPVDPSVVDVAKEFQLSLENLIFQLENKTQPLLDKLKEFFNTSTLSESYQAKFKMTLNDRVNQAVKQFEGVFKLELFDLLTSRLSESLDEAYKDFGKCKLFHNAFTIVERAFCSHLLMPYNGFWFSLGWCVMFFIPVLIIISGLLILYERKKLTSSSDVEMKYLTN